MKIQPLGDRIVVRPSEKEEKTAGGILIPETAKEKPLQGKVVAVGAGRRNKKGERVPVEVKAGETVLYERYAGSKVEIEGEEYLVLREDEVLGRL